ncbi:MAG: transcription elongation factor GreA [Candidatus Daviesbacteria bacterium]|nr:transcription elongation factor GreA [Candidatus Daviesbacteria bacterium]
MIKDSRSVRSASNIYFTLGGLQEAKLELDFLKTIKRVEASERILKAREFEDIDESSEYQAALDEQALIEHRIADLEESLRSPKVITQNQNSDTITLGSTVRINIDGKIDEYTIVGKVEADPTKKRISNESPLGASLLGLRAGEKAQVTTPTFKYEAKVLKIR